MTTFFVSALLVLFPCFVVIAFNRSFIGRWVLGLELPTWMMQLFRCPLCLGFDFSLVWFLSAWLQGWIQLEAHTYVMLCLGSGVMCYVSEHLILLIEAVKDRNEIETARMLQQIEENQPFGE